MISTRLPNLMSAVCVKNRKKWEEMTTFIFTWNPSIKRMGIKGIIQLKTQLENGEKTINEWGCQSNKKVKKGDRAFISKVGSGSRGLFASGVVVSDGGYKYENKKYVDIKFDYIFDPYQNIYEISRLKEEISGKPKLWNPQSSGTSIPKELEKILEICWNDFVSSININIEVAKIKKDKKIPSTQKEALIQARVGQGKFRKNILELWDGKCSVTGCSMTELLIASHIKPWKDCNNKERLDKFNGLFLTPNIDKLFDQGIISFADNGKILISSKLNKKDREKLGINENMKITNVSQDHKKYLSYHRKNKGFK